MYEKNECVKDDQEVCIGEVRGRRGLKRLSEVVDILKGVCSYDGCLPGGCLPGRV